MTAARKTTGRAQKPKPAPKPKASPEDVDALTVLATLAQNFVWHGNAQQVQDAINAAQAALLHVAARLGIEDGADTSASNTEGDIQSPTADQVAKTV